MQGVDTHLALGGMLGSLQRIVGYYQTMSLPLNFLNRLPARVASARITQGRQEIGELAIASPGHRQDELQRLRAPRQRQLAERIEVVQREQTPVSHNNQSLDVRIARQHFFKRRLQRGRLGRVAVKHLVIDRHAVARLHHAQHELARDHAFFGHAKAAYIRVLLAEPCSANRREVIEHDRQLLIDERAQQPGDAIVHRRLMIHQGIHAAQQLLMGQRFRLDTGHAHRLQPAQHTEFGVRVAQPVEDHRAQRLLDRRGEPGAPEHGGETVKPQFMPKLVKCPDITQCERRFEAQLRRRTYRRWTTFAAQESAEQRIDLATVFINTSERCNRALTRLAVVITKRLHQLSVGVTSGASELDEHTASVICNSNIANTYYLKYCHYKKFIFAILSD